MMALAAAFFVAEAFVPSHGALTLAGAVTFVIGALMLFDPAGEAYQVSLWVALAIAGTLALLLGVALTRVVKARRNPVEVSVERMVGGEAVVRRDGWVSVAGELYRMSDDVWRRVEEGEPPRLYRGPVRLAGGRTADGILYPRALAEGRHKDISEFGDWRAYIASLGPSP